MTVMHGHVEPPLEHLDHALPEELLRHPDAQPHGDALVDDGSGSYTLRNGGLLELYPPDDNAFELGGFTRLKEWLARAQVGFTPEAQALGLPEGFSGVIQDSASSATLSAVLTMRERALEWAGNRAGLSNAWLNLGLVHHLNLRQPRERASALWRDVLPTTAHRWAVEQPGRLQVLDCVPLSAESASVPVLTDGRISPLDRVDDCREPDLPRKLAATGVTHLLVRRAHGSNEVVDGSAGTVGPQASTCGTAASVCIGGWGPSKRSPARGTIPTSVSMATLKIIRSWTTRGRPSTSRAYSMTTACRPRQMPSSGTPFSRA